jgi:uncharacterized protein YbjQ (UPF0145 family)
MKTILRQTLVRPALRPCGPQVGGAASRHFFSQPPLQQGGVSPLWATTGLDFPGCRIVENRGVVRGVVVRSRNFIMDYGGQIQSLFGGNVTIYSQLCESARQEALSIMLQHAADVGGNAVIGLRYDTGTIHQATEVLCYGTAVRIEAAAVVAGRV